MSETLAGAQSPRTAHVEVVDLIASGRATSRVAISRALGIAPSTASLRVQELIDAGVVVESGSGTSTGGRRAKALSLAPDGSCVLAIDLGAHHARIALVDTDGAVRTVEEIPIDIASGPTAVLGAVIDAALAFDGRPQVRGIGLALPGPVNVDTGAVTLPSRMPGWKDFAVRDWIAQTYGVAVVVDNDANLMAYGEHIARGSQLHDTVTVKAGTAIGAGMIVQGRIHRGATFAAGDITHVRIDAAGDRPCSCGNHGCLETIASGAGLLTMLRARGVDVETTADVVGLAQRGDPIATTAVRGAGARLGQVLCAVTNFFNPSAIYLGGLLSTVEPFVAAVRSEVYQGSHPLATQHLTIERTLTDSNAALIGAARLAIEHTLRLDTPAQRRGV